MDYKILIIVIMVIVAVGSVISIVRYYSKRKAQRKDVKAAFGAIPEGKKPGPCRRLLEQLHRKVWCNPQN
ncbi:MAG: hypothetical protein GXY32_08340 [Ruminococcaceae bacterium]|nr:hypothetical protein [Oscillospiraceae bacterium]